MPFTYDRDGPTVQPAVRLSDVLPGQRSLSTFSSLARRCAAVDEVLSSSGRNTTVLAPANTAVEALPRKPWEEDPRKLEAEGFAAGDGDGGGAGAYEGEEGRERADRNMRRFVEAHLVGRAPWGEGEKVKTLDGDGGGGGAREVWWETRADGKRVVMPDGVEVESVASRVGNGELWILKGVLNYAA
ncbi:hypothetical protein N3K66_005394 [Trichothecium roseum]|uniref:Uncharacterized protein n=1 Tax=Trichothecium roseum TaxID=47278 RepID=A0ACC0UXU0_9HYPO|nr:hypothetical protein N3K66_005394 [Trichothecium roseum]